MRIDKNDKRRFIKNTIVGLILMFTGISAMNVNNSFDYGFVFMLGGEAFLGIGIVEYFYNKSIKIQETLKRKSAEDVSV